MARISDTHDFYLNQIHQLKQLQKVDDIIHEERQIIESAPRALQELEARFDAVDQRRARIVDKIEHLRDQEARLRREMEEEGERLRKSKDKLMATGSEREYNAVTREIDNLEKLTQPREDERVRLLDELKLQNAELDEIAGEHAELKAQLEARRLSLEEDLAGARARLEKLERDRAACGADIPAPIFQRYEFIRERLDHPVIVALSDSICPSCHIAIPPQTFNDLLRGGQILSCPNCQRLIVWRDDYIADDPEAQAEASAEQASEPARQAPKKAPSVHSALDYKDEKEEVDFAAPDDELDDELRMGNLESDLNSMSRMADVADLADMSEMTGITDMGFAPDEGEKR